MRGLIGEWTTLGMNTSKQMSKVYADHAKGRALVGAGCHAERTSEAIELVNYADKVGCDFAWITPPTAPLRMEEDILLHYQTIIDNTSLPLAVYNCNLTELTAQSVLNVLNLSDRIVALKDSGGNFDHWCELFRLGVAKKVAVFPMQRSMLPVLMLGSQGVLGFPHDIVLTVACYNAFKKGDLDKAWQLELRLVGERMGEPNVPKLTPRPMSALKMKTSLVTGIDMGSPALPAPPATKEDIEIIKKHIAKWKLLDVDAPVPEW